MIGDITDRKCQFVTVSHMPSFFAQVIILWVFICDVLRDLVPFLQFKKREKHPWRIVTFSKVAGF